ncbi:ABC transporter ATP-binding protein [Actinomadura sp. KC216]|uniref:ABC transporter ATP-binding protein n=1 Tax=Actinomadura sp. KC216 TaxID=2530370 RepID=UPI0010446FA1|nr:ABC transporter ATP-binding protein [Actinomadura sp. KC216]TDB86314.1 ABC transporter ATP-binding protein [Actinomadura sp. KC216]
MAHQEASPPPAAVSAAARLRVRAVAKTFPNGTEALAPVDLDMAGGEFVSLLGPSGCGKSTLLRIIAGLTEPSAGTVELPDEHRRAFVFQDPTLLPWRTVERNARLLLELEGVPKEERAERAAAALKMVGLAGFEKSYPRNLSGGMRMRLSLARALALRPKFFLMDEPFSALDEITRETLQDELLRIWGAEGFTSVFVTHNLYEAIYLSHRVVVMSPRPGRVARIFEIPFEYPRSPTLRETPEFSALGAEVAACLREVSR